MRAVADRLGRGDFLLPTKVKTATARYARAIDSVRSWIQDERRVGEGYTIGKKGAYIQYGQTAATTMTAPCRAGGSRRRAPSLTRGGER